MNEVNKSSMNKVVKLNQFVEDLNGSQLTPPTFRVKEVAFNTF